MTQSQQSLIESFANGAESGSASSMKIETDGDETILVGYDWAIYARRHADGSITAFDGWRGYSRSTNQQLAKVRRVADVVDERRSPTIRGYPQSVHRRGSIA